MKTGLWGMGMWPILFGRAECRLQVIKGSAEMVSYLVKSVWFLSCWKPCILSDCPRPACVHACIRASGERVHTRDLFTVPLDVRCIRCSVYRFLLYALHTTSHSNLSMPLQVARKTSKTLTYIHRFGAEYFIGITTFGFLWCSGLPSFDRFGSRICKCSPKRVDGARFLGNIQQPHGCSDPRLSLRVLIMI